MIIYWFFRCRCPCVIEIVDHTTFFWCNNKVWIIFTLTSCEIRCHCRWNILFSINILCQIWKIETKNKLWSFTGCLGVVALVSLAFLIVPFSVDVTATFWLFPFWLVVKLDAIVDGIFCVISIFYVDMKNRNTKKCYDHLQVLRVLLPLSHRNRWSYSILLM